MKNHGCEVQTVSHPPVAGEIFIIDAREHQDLLD